MAKKISQLPAVVTPSDADQFEVNQGGVSKVQTLAQIRAGMAALGHTHTADEITETPDNKVMTAAERAKLGGIEDGAEANPGAASQAEAEAGTEADLRSWSPLRVKQAIDALAPSGGGSISIEDQGTAIASDVATLNFIGEAVTAAAAGNGRVDVTVTAGSAQVDSVFGRTGAVMAQNGDYDIGQITNAGDLAALDLVGTAQLANGAGNPAKTSFGSSMAAPAPIGGVSTITLDPNALLYTASNAGTTTVRINTPSARRNVEIMNTTGAAITIVDQSDQPIRAGVPNRHIAVLAWTGSAWSFQAELSTRLHAHTADEVSDTASKLLMTPAERAKLSGIEDSADANPNAASQAEAEAGVDAGLRSWSPLRVRQAILALAPGGGEGGSAQFVSIEDFGATRGTFDGTTAPDSTAAIQAAIDSVSGGNAGGGIVLIPRGVWWHSGLQMKPRVRLQGEGWNSVLKLLPNSDQHSIRNSDNVDPQGRGVDEGYQVCDLAIDGNRNAQNPNNWRDGIHFEMSTTNSEYVNSPGNIFKGPDPEWRLHNLKITEIVRDGIFVSGRGGGIASDLWVGSCRRTGIRANAFDNTWTNCYVGGIAGTGFHVGSGPNKFVGCKAFFTGQATQWLNNGEITGADDGVSAEDWRYGAGWHLTAQQCEMAACEVQDTWSHGIILQGAGDCSLDFTAGNCGALQPRYGLGRSPILTDIAAVVFLGNARDNRVRVRVRDQYTRNGSGGIHPTCVHAVNWANGGSTAGILRNDVTAHISAGGNSSGTTKHITGADENVATPASNWSLYRS